MALDLTHRQKASTTATELLRIQLNEIHEEHLYLKSDIPCGTHFWTYVFYVIVLLVIAVSFLTLAMLVYFARYEGAEEQRLRTREERYKACNRFCPDCDAVMYDAGMRPTSEVYVYPSPNVSQKDQLRGSSTRKEIQPSASCPRQTYSTQLESGQVFECG